MFDLVDDYIEVFCGGRCLEFFYIQYGGYNVREEFMDGGYRGSDFKYKY